MKEMPNMPAAPCKCWDPEDDCGCVCGDSERVLRHVQRGGIALDSEQREWCLSEIDNVEGYDRREHVGNTDPELAHSVLCAWTDYARDKGLL